MDTLALVPHSGRDTGIRSPVGRSRAAAESDDCRRVTSAWQGAGRDAELTPRRALRLPVPRNYSRP